MAADIWNLPLVPSERLTKLEQRVKTLEDGFARYLLAQMEYTTVVEASLVRLERLAGISEA